MQSPDATACPPDTHSTARFLARVLQAVANGLVSLLFLLLAISSYQHFVRTGSVRSFGVLAVNALIVVLFLTRRPAKAETSSLPLWALGLAGTVLPLLLRPGDGLGPVQFATVVQIVGLAMLASALLALRRSFAVVPANRGIRDGGPYRFARHPVYTSELLVLLGVVLANPTGLNLAIWLCECGLQYARARAEEVFLSADPAYQSYRERVRHRFVPGLL